MISSARLFLTALALFILVSCSPEVKTGPGEVRWDRMSCELCRMAVSDHYYSAQVRGGPEGKRTKLYYFDDLGCAILWLIDQEWKNDPRTEIWVNDQHTGEWINAREAYYSTGNITPMDFGLGATLEKADSLLRYREVVKHIYQNEERKKQNRTLINFKPSAKDKDI